MTCVHGFQSRWAVSDAGAVNGVPMMGWSPEVLSDPGQVWAAHCPVWVSQSAAGAMQSACKAHGVLGTVRCS